jgi:hypothetical protein
MRHEALLNPFNLNPEPTQIVNMLIGLGSPPIGELSY